MDDDWKVYIPDVYRCPKCGATFIDDSGNMIKCPECGADLKDLEPEMALYWEGD